MESFMVDAAAAVSGPAVESKPRPSRRARPLVLRLAALCGAIILPAYAFVAVLLTHYAQSTRHQFERAGIENARDIADTLDRDISSLTAVLQTLSFSTRLSIGDFFEFTRLASRVANASGVPIVLSDPSGQQIVNTRAAPGSPLPRMAVSYQSVIDSRRPVVTDLFTGSLSQDQLFSVAVPVVDETTQAVTHVLNFSIDPVRVRDVLLKSALSSGSTASVIDRKGRLIARSVGHERLVGTFLSDLIAQIGTASEGQLRQANLDGDVALMSFTRMKSTGWIVSHGYPVEAVDAPTRWLILQLAGLALATALVAVVGGFVLSRRIVSALASLESAASAVGQGATVAPVRTTVTEIDRVGERLAAASRDLRLTTVAKDALLYEVNHRVKNSLAVVTSLLSLQVRQTPDTALKQGLEDLRARIDVIASVHQRLYESGRHDRLDLGSFLREIAADMTHALGGARYRFTSSCEEGIVIGVDRTTPLALIVGELLTNAVKHGGDRSHGEISLEVRRIGEGRILVAVADDGAGLPANFGQPGTSGVGFRIVTGLVRQIRGQIETNAGEAGARFEIILNEATE
ncbi:MAG: signal transduction histidine kinase [Hyphomicrobiales bacterium]|nr:signal transduction histidine kinase [Hyphomicrobiales bacterium]